jgi:hypothetical protein
MESKALVALLLLWTACVEGRREFGFSLLLPMSVVIVDCKSFLCDDTNSVGKLKF